MTRTHDSSLRRIAYFSMEVGIGAQIPTYSGGLGVLALYDKLERAIIPTFYQDRDRFVEMMRLCIALNGS